VYVTIRHLGSLLFEAESTMCVVLPAPAAATKILFFDGILNIEWDCKCFFSLQNFQSIICLVV